MEKAFGEDGKFLSSRKVSFNNTYYQFNGEGFWEKSVNGDRLDIVFLIDSTGSMERYMEEIKKQIRDFLNRLVVSGTDFRMIVAEYSAEDEPAWPSGREVDTFYDVTMLKELEEEIESISTGGEGWNFTWAYDAFLWTLDLDWREDSRKIVVIITDVYTDSLYGPNWYFSSGCNVSMYAVDLALRRFDIHLYYCQPPESEMAETEISEGYSPDVNPKVKLSNFDMLEKINDKVRRMKWPFDQNKIELAESPVVDSKYYFAWISDWSDYRFVSRIDVEIRLIGTSDSASFTYYPLKNPDGSDAVVYSENLMITVKDESGLTLLGNDNVWVNFYRVMGNTSRMDIVGAMYQMEDRNGLLNLGKRQIGRYYYILYSSGRPSERYEQLRYTGRGWIEVGTSSATPSDMVAYTSGRDAELLRAYGLLMEIEHLEINTERMNEFVRTAQAWLSSIEENGVTLVEIEVLKRFNNALAAMLNCAGYACVVQEKTSNEAVEIVQKISEMIRKAEEIADELVSSYHIITKIVNTFIDIITGNWSGAAASLSIEEVINRFVDYVRNDLLDDIMDTVESKIVEVVRDPDSVLSFIDSLVERSAGKDFSPDQIEDVTKKFVSQELVYKRFSNTLEDQMIELLETSRGFVEENKEKYWNAEERTALIEQSFEEMRYELMTDLFEVSYEKLSQQERIDSWGSVLEVFETTIPLIVEFIELFEVRYPELKPVKESLKMLIDALDAIETLTTTYEMSLKVDHLTTLNERLGGIVTAVYRYR